ncbi:hypothetical protein PC9H_008978 [Pleurotus ostreatus]|uniref:Uncharacterized protein n=2 Tax=Pleurotus ostreatus TaxID=5322 RepID=A0A8H6ZSP7_PLEOS|nr:uncharacterized protein PC9H_008978 [Pleurotus ostreatus]KAF7426609.1 hypothetical protein PC9H_008978 [Pleurotus ostreatus]KAJ8694190.1 hypothetical protein PTI98_009118 [Pleurotus ostreatus]KAJ8694191.1 hypothetical protein PTI98_009118 [Pleurotus ostreatus]
MLIHPTLPHRIFRPKSPDSRPQNRPHHGLRVPDRLTRTFSALFSKAGPLAARSPSPGPSSTAAPRTPPNSPAGSIHESGSCEGCSCCQRHRFEHECDVMHLQEMHNAQLEAVSRLLRESQQQVQMLCDILRPNEEWVGMASMVQTMLLSVEQARMDECAEEAGLEICDINSC